MYIVLSNLVSHTVSHTLMRHFNLHFSWRTIAIRTAYICVLLCGRYEPNQWEPRGKKTILHMDDVLAKYCLVPSPHLKNVPKLFQLKIDFSKTFGRKKKKKADALILKTLLIRLVIHVASLLWLVFVQRHKPASDRVSDVK